MYGKAHQISSWLQALADAGWTQEGVRKAFGRVAETGKTINIRQWDEAAETAPITGAEIWACEQRDRKFATLNDLPISREAYWEYRKAYRAEWYRQKVKKRCESGVADQSKI